MTVDTFNQLLDKLSTVEALDSTTEKEIQMYDMNIITPQLIDLIIDQNENSQLRCRAVKVLQWRKQSSAIAGIKDTLLLDFDNQVRIAIIEFIGSLKEASMLSTLIKLVNRDDDIEVIRAASLAIQIIQGITPDWSFDS